MKKSEDELKKENTTKYGEFVCTEYQWLPLEKQKEQADKMANMTKKKRKKRLKKCNNNCSFLIYIY